jgi:hypothetical protein
MMHIDFKIHAVRGSRCGPRAGRRRAAGCGLGPAVAPAQARFSLKGHAWRLNNIKSS